jgi:hypothetical protein
VNHIWHKYGEQVNLCDRHAYGIDFRRRPLPLHPGTNALIHDYLDAAGHGSDDNGALFRPIRNNRTGRLEKAVTPDAVYKLVRTYSALLGFEIGAHALRATAGIIIIRIRSICSSAAVSLSRFGAAPKSSITPCRTSPLYCRPMKWQGKLASIFGGTDIANLFSAKQFPWPLPS